MPGLGKSHFAILSFKMCKNSVFKDTKAMHLAANNYEDFKATVIEYFGESLLL